MSASRPDGPPRIALVTGASRGIGRAAALAFAKSGAHVVALARTQGGLEELDDEIRALRPEEPEATTLVPMDLRDFAAIDRLGEALYRRWGRLDAFVGNAGVLGLLTPLHHLDPKTWDDVMAVNVTANWRLIRSLDPLLAPLRRGARRVHNIRRGKPGRAARLLGPVRDIEGGARRPRPHLCRRDPQHVERPRHAGQSGTAANANAGDRDARRRPLDAARAAKSLRPRLSRSARPIGQRRASSTTFRRTGSSVSKLPPEQKGDPSAERRLPFFDCGA